VVFEHFERGFRDYFLKHVNCLIRFIENEIYSQINFKDMYLLHICECHIIELYKGGHFYSYGNIFINKDS
jgi:hypothetical protein